LQRTPRRGPQEGKPKLPLPAIGLVERADAAGPRPALATAALHQGGLAALRAMMRDRRLADPMKFAHVRQELGIDPTWRGEARGHEATAAGLLTVETRRCGRPTRNGKRK
jgi:hypothetical protein